MPQSKSTEPSILLCTETEPALAAVERLLAVSKTPRKLATAGSLIEIEKQMAAHSFECILVDFDLLGDNGDSRLAAAKTICEQNAVILIAGDAQGALLDKAIEVGVEDYLLSDDLEPERVGRAINNAIRRRQRLSRTRPAFANIETLESVFARIFRSHCDAMLILGKDHDIRSLNTAAVSLLELDEASVIGEIFPFAVEEGEVTELEIPTAGNRIQSVELLAFELVWKGEASLLIVLREITAGQKAAQDLSHGQARLRLLLDSMTDGVVLTDGGGCIECVNRRMGELLGSDPETKVGLHLSEIIKSEPSAPKSTAQSSVNRIPLPTSPTEPSHIGCRIQLADGQELPASAVLHSLFDETGERRSGLIVIRRTEHPADETSKEPFDGDPLNSVGLLVGGIAHDFNNMLSAILGNLALARLATESEEVLTQKLDAAESAALQAKSLSQQLLTFSRAGTLNFTETNILEIIEEYARFSLRGSNVDFKLTAPDTLWPVSADTGRIGQIINNLLINADQAMPKGGCIEIGLRNLSIRRAEVPDLSPGDYVCIEVKDTGTGITPEHLKQIFMPYFTTKPNGNGLGLASSFAIARNHKGTITADSSFGYGSIFRVYLPRSVGSEAETEEQKPEKMMKNAKNIQPGHGRILLMDDMEAMLMVASEILSMLGYEVECCADGAEAIESYKKAKESGNPFDAVVFDLTVPGGMGGEEAANLLKEYDAGLIAIASSGYSNSNVMSDHKNSAFKAVVPKPYRIDEMSDALHSVLKGR